MMLRSATQVHNIELRCRLGVGHGRQKDWHVSQSVIYAHLEDVAVFVLGDAFGIATSIGFVTEFDIHDRAGISGQRCSSIESVTDDVSCVKAGSVHEVPIGGEIAWYGTRSV